MTQPQHSPKYLDNERHADGKKSAFQKTTLRSTFPALNSAQPKSILLFEINAMVSPSQTQSIRQRDGELVVLGKQAARH